MSNENRGSKVFFHFCLPWVEPRNERTVGYKNAEMYSMLFTRSLKHRLVLELAR